jgi:cytochrome c biogenesis protein CcmG/thiol:disulfide interchange protein DsbE
MDEELAEHPELSRHHSNWGRAFFVAMLLVAVALAFLLRPRREPENPLVGASLAQVDLQPLTGQGKPVAQGDLAGKVILLNFWGTWCPPCREEFPHLVSIYDEFRGRSDFRFLSVSSGSGLTEPEADVNMLRQDTLEFLYQARVDLPTYTDAEGRTRQAVDKAGGFVGYPTTLVFDRRSVIRGAWVGYVPGVEKQIRDLVVKLLEE